VAEWDALVRRSPQGTLFAESSYQQAVGCPYHLWNVVQGGAVKAGVCLQLSRDGHQVVGDDLVIYAGILFDLDLRRRPVKRRHDEFQIAEHVAAELAQRFDGVQLQLAPQFGDVRPFLWHDYHHDRGNHYAVHLRYTSYLDISSLSCLGGDPAAAERSECFARMESVRRYSVREARRKGGTVRTATSGEQLISFYRALMSEQGEAPSQHNLDAMQRVISSLIARDRGALFHVHDANDELLYCVMYGWDAKRAYYLFGAGSATRSAPWQGTLAHWAAFQYLAQEHGVREIDMEGVNSPQRGWFKLSFGGDLRPYYRLRLNKSSTAAEVSSSDPGDACRSR
jgi:hypothetical protein